MFLSTERCAAWGQAFQHKGTGRVSLHREVTARGQTFQYKGTGRVSLHREVTARGRLFNIKVLVGFLSTER